MSRALVPPYAPSASDRRYDVQGVRELRWLLLAQVEGFILRVGFRPENIMIATTQSESSAYHRPLPHASAASSVASSEQWASARSSASSALTPIQPPASARGTTNTPSVFRPSSSVSHSSTPISHLHSSHSSPLEQPSTTSQSHSGPASSSPSATSSSVNSPNSRKSPSRSKRTSEDTPPVVIQNLSQVVDLPRQEPLSNSPPKRNRSGGEDRQRYEISGMPVPDVIEMVAGLLTKITTTNDQQHPQLHRNIPPPEATAGMSGTTNSVLAFHGKNVPSITILSYLSRIHKYCPTTYEVFLSLLVYFDRMTERVNKNPALDWKGGATAPSGELCLSDASDPYNFSHFFVVDSFNIHRLVIAGVTCASKFFSDVFYTNSRYAKVGGLPLAELNHLELQFLILNDFRLAVPVEELEAYGTMLVQFYAREAVANADLRGIGLPSTTAGGTVTV